MQLEGEASDWNAFEATDGAWSTSKSAVTCRFVLRGTGKALPDRRLDNDTLGAELGVEPGSILARTGIRERRIAGCGDSTASLAAQAARAALRAADCRAADLDLVLLSTYTPDRLLCPTAPEVAAGIAASRAGAFDINSACSGGVTALLTACSFLTSGLFRRILVVASDVTTRFLRADDQKTRLIFGDGAAAMLLEKPSTREHGAWAVLAATCGSDGSGARLFGVPGPIGARSVEGAGNEIVVRMEGAAVYRFAIERGDSLVRELLSRAQLESDAVQHVVPHQANGRIIAELAERSRISPDRWFQNLGEYGNTASASVPLAFGELVESGRVKRGDIVMLLAFGAGLTWCGAVLRAA